MLQALEFIIAVGVVVWAARTMIRRGGYDISRTPVSPDPSRRDED